MNRFITKILDEYYTHKLIDEIEDSVTYKYDLDFKTEWKNDRINLYVKKRKYKDEHYKRIYVFDYCDSLMWLIKIDAAKTTVDNNIKGYLNMRNNE